jgi:hypothetical protein
MLQRCRCRRGSRFERRRKFLSQRRRLTGGLWPYEPTCSTGSVGRGQDFKLLLEDSRHLTLSGVAGGGGEQCSVISDGASGRHSNSDFGRQSASKNISEERSRIYGDVLVPAPSVKKDEEDERIRIVHTLKRVQSFLILFRGKSSLKIYTENWEVRAHNHD